MELHHRISKLRKERQLSQEMLAEKLYVSRQTISNWERGKTYPDLQSLLLLGTYFDVTLDYLVKGDVLLMKETLAQKDARSFKKWLLAAVILWFVFSVAYPTRYLLDWRVFGMLISLISICLVYSLFQVYHIGVNHQLRTYAAIVRFIDETSEVDYKPVDEVKLVFGLLIGSFFIFFVGTVVSALLFWQAFK